MEELVSVIIPTYSRPQFIERAIASVLNQTYKSIEIIVVDDNGKGTDFQIETEKLLKRYINKGIIKYIVHTKNMNGAAARNSGILACKGKYVTFLDDDDEMKPSKIEKQVNSIINGKENIGGSYCGYEKCSSGKIIQQKKAFAHGNLQKDLFLNKWEFGTGSNPLYKKEVFDKCGLFDVSFRRHQDIEILIRFFRYYEIACVPDILVTKNVDSNLLRPSSIVYMSVTEHYLTTYASDISKFPQDVINSIYYSNWFLNVILALIERNYKLSFQLIKKIQKFKCISIKDWLRIIKYGVFTNKLR